MSEILVSLCTASPFDKKVKAARTRLGPTKDIAWAHLFVKLVLENFSARKMEALENCAERPSGCGHFGRARGANFDNAEDRAPEWLGEWTNGSEPQIK